MFPLLSLYILKPLLRNMSFKYLKKKKDNEMTRKNLTLQRFSSQLLYPLASTIIGHRPFSRFIRSKRAIRREREKKREKYPR